MHMILACIYAVFSLIILKPVQMVAMYYKKHGQEEKCYRITDYLVPRWMGTVLWLAGIKVDVEGEQNFPEGPAVFICNHQGLLDIPVMLTHMGKPRAMMSKDTIGKVPLLRGWMELFDCIFVDRKNHNSARKAYNDAVALLQKGRSVCLCPEGTRSKTGGIGPFKTGAFRMAAQVGVPIVPMYLNGTRDLMENNHGWIKSGRVHMKFFPVEPVPQLTEEQRAALPDKLHDMMDASLQAENAEK